MVLDTPTENAATVFVLVTVTLAGWLVMFSTAPTGSARAAMNAPRMGGDPSAGTGNVESGCGGIGEGETEQRAIRAVAPDRPLIVFDLVRRSDRRVCSDKPRRGVARNRPGQIEIDLLGRAGAEVDHFLRQQRTPQPQHRGAEQVLHLGALEHVGVAERQAVDHATPNTS